MTIDAGAGADTIYSPYSRNSINGGADADRTSLGSASNHGTNKILGGTGNDTIYLNSATTLGNVYVYNSGDGSDKIYYATKYDTVSIGGATYKRSTVGSDLILSVTGGGAMTLVGAANTAVNIKGSLEPEDSGLVFNSNKLAVTVKANYGSTLKSTDYPSSVITIDASARTNGINIAGNSKNNNILGSSGADTLSGGAGSDTLTGGAGADIFLYTAGNDVIKDYDYSEQDIIYLSSGTFLGTKAFSCDLSVILLIPLLPDESTGFTMTGRWKLSMSAAASSKVL